MADYVGTIAASGRAPASASMALAAVRFRSMAQGRANPAGRLSRAALARFRRAHPGRGRGQASGIGWNQADIIAAVAASAGTLAGLRDAALVAVMSDAMLRVSELATLTAADIERAGDGSGRVTVRRSKTDQEGQGATLYLGKPTMRALRDWTAAAGIADGPVFRRVRRGGHPAPDAEARPLSPVAVRAVIRRRARAAGLDAPKVRGHSLRVGSAQSLVAAGASTAEVMQDGRWASARMVARYTAAQAAARRGTARHRYGAEASPAGSNPRRGKYGEGKEARALWTGTHARQWSAAPARSAANGLSQARGCRCPSCSRT